MSNTKFPRVSNRLGERFALIVVGYTGKQIEEFLFDYLLYGAVATYFAVSYGPLWGSLGTFLVMSPFSALVCFLYVKFYDWSKTDWFGFESIKTLRDTDAKGFWLRLVHRIARMGDIPAFIAFSIYFDPFMTTMYLRKGAEKYNGMNRRDYLIFFSSVILSNAYWALQLSILIGLAHELWLFFSSVVL